MKKSVIIAGAVAAIMAGSAIADTTVYGRARMGLVVSADDDTKVGLANGSSRFGFKGSEDLGNGMSAIYHYELGYDADNNGQAGTSPVSNRIGLVGLKGDFGTIAMGNMWTPVYNLVSSATDKFNLIYNDAQYAISGRAGDALAYVNKFGAVDVQVALVANDSGAESDLVDVYNIAAKYTTGALAFGLGFQKDSDNTNGAFSVSYKGDGFYAAFLTYNAEDFGGDKVNTIAATFDVGSNGKIAARVSNFDLKDDTGTTFGYQHNMSKRTQAFFEMSNNVVGAKYLTGRTIIGLKHNF